MFENDIHSGIYENLSIAENVLLLCYDKIYKSLFSYVRKNDVNVLLMDYGLKKFFGKSSIYSNDSLSKTNIYDRQMILLSKWSIFKPKY